LTIALLNGQLNEWELNNNNNNNNNNTVIIISTFSLQQWRPLDPQADTSFPWK